MDLVNSNQVAAAISSEAEPVVCGQDSIVLQSGAEMAELATNQVAQDGSVGAVQTQPSMYQHQVANGMQASPSAVNAVVNAAPQHQGHGYTSLTPQNQTASFTQPQMQPAQVQPGTPQGYAQLNTISLGQQLNAAGQVMHTIMPMQNDASAITNQSQPQMNNMPVQQNPQYNGMPQMILSAGQPIQGIQTAQLLIPTSSGMASQQILTIPINQATSNQMIQMVAPNGQVFTSSVASLQAMSSVQQMGATLMPSQQQIIQATATGNTFPQQVVQQQPQAPQIITNSSGQVIAMTNPPNIVQSQQPISSQPAITPNINSGNGMTNASSMPQIQQVQQPKQTSLPPAQSTIEKPCSTTSENPSPSPGPVKSETKIEVCDSACSTPLIPCVSSTQNFLQEPSSVGNGDASSTTLDIDLGQDPGSPGPGVNSLDDNIVDGINLEEIKDFAKAFKLRRLSLGLTQTQVGEALSATEGPAYSQSAICRFEKLDITPKSALRIKPVLERWLSEAEERYKSGHENLTEYIAESSKKRKRRTSFTPQALDILNNFFKGNTHPTGPEMTSLANSLNYDREVVRVWFCNKRQALKNTVKRLQTEQPII